MGLGARTFYTAGGVFGQAIQILFSQWFMYKQMHSRIAQQLPGWRLGVKTISICKTQLSMHTYLHIWAGQDKYGTPD